MLEFKENSATCRTTAVEDSARPFPMTIEAGPGSPETKCATKPTTTAVTKTSIMHNEKGR
jgi:hypothetical protein